MHIHRKPSFLRGYAVQRLRRSTPMRAQDLLSLSSKLRSGEARSLDPAALPCEARPGAASPAVIYDHHRRVSSSKHP